MIRIEKPDTPPEVLRTEGIDKRRSHSISFAYDPEGFRSGERNFEFDSDIYGDDAVKTTLIEAQYRKCCFCESKIRHVTYGDVEHFRPKAGYRQTPNQDLQRPGYYWLAYEWTNLFLSCPLCNRRHKANVFPLRNPEDRATSHRDEIDEEAPSFSTLDETTRKRTSGFGRPPRSPGMAPSAAVEPSRPSSLIGMPSMKCAETTTRRRSRN